MIPRKKEAVDTSKTMADKDYMSFNPTPEYFEKHILKKHSSRISPPARKQSSGELKALLGLVLLLIVCTVLLLYLDSNTRHMLKQTLAWP